MFSRGTGFQYVKMRITGRMSAPLFISQKPFMMQLSIPFAVGVGGCAGALLRYYITTSVTRWVGEPQAFVGTLTVNLIGSFLIGVLAVVVDRTTHLSPHSQRVLITGLLGSMTTFSTFSLDSVNLLQQGRVGAAILNVTSNVIAGVLLAWCGMLIAGTVFPESPDQKLEANSAESEINL